MAKTPYFYGDLHAHLHRAANSQPAQPPRKTTGMVCVPATFALFGLGMFACLAWSAVEMFRWGQVGGGLGMLLYSLITVPYVVLPLISIRNFLQRRK